MPSNAAIFVTLVAGFLFVSLFDFTRFLAQTWNGPRLVFWSGAFGIFLVGLSALAVDRWEELAVVLTHLEWAAQPPFLIPPHILIAFGASVALPVLGNLLTKRSALARLSRYHTNQFMRFLDLEFRETVQVAKLAARAAKARERAARSTLRWRRLRARAPGPFVAVLALLARLERDRAGRIGRAAEKTFGGAAERLSARLVQLTLADDKVYVGYVVSMPSPASSETYFRFLPTLSGYRDKATREIRFTTNYSTLIRATEDPKYHLDGGDLQAILPINQVTNARIFDPAAYKDHFAGEIPPPESFSE